MEIKIRIGAVDYDKSAAVIAGIYEDCKPEHNLDELDNATGGVITRALESGDFKGKLNTTYLIPVTGSKVAERILLVGLGKKKEFTLDRLRQVSGRSAVFLSGLGVTSYSTTLSSLVKPISDACQAITEGSILGLYRFDQYKTSEDKNNGRKDIEEITLLIPDKKDESRAIEGAFRGRVLAEAANFCRDLVNHPSNLMTPSVMADTARLLADNFGFSCNVMEREELEGYGMGSLLGVAKGSSQPPRFIILEYRGSRKGKPVVLAGKAITFDSGGISIKPAENMDKMKSDMAGGAAVMGTFMAAAGLKLPVHIIGIIPAVENMPDGSALKPGDILKAMNGKTIEIISTDAEGRLILADALCFASRFKPSAVIDIATLTGACVVALGKHAAGMMGTDDALKSALKKAGDRSVERVWELPLWPEYDELLKSDIADMKNAGGREAGAIAGGMFLKNFINYPWAHLDIAGTAWDSTDGPYRPKGATGTGVRLLTEFLMAWK